MTWAELELLPQEIGREIELWEGKVVWNPRGQRAHSRFIRRATNAIERCADETTMLNPSIAGWLVCHRVDVFPDLEQMSDFLTPDIVVTRRMPLTEYVRAADTLLVGEVRFRSNPCYIEAKKARYAHAGIHWYWEIVIAPSGESITAVKAYERTTLTYKLVGEWTSADEHGIAVDQPFPIHIPWTELEF
ncbi:Uma2 family endonuclease [Nocardia stercoris]|uniref:Uma2 family endonuclease n=2 Tax=Nocardia stercoris TaxID=2483361 RepID=A0A3M2L5Y2_9NOCA|nr:Uma2 family endonuclease [Nocardia stercoris]